MADFDMKKMTTNDWILAGGCLAMFIGLFLKWFAIGGGTVGSGDFSFAVPEFSVTGTHYPLQGWLPWLLAVGILVVLVLRKFVPDVKLPDQIGQFTWNQVILAASGLSALLVLSRLLMGDSGTDRKIGLFLSSLGVVAMVVGAFLKYQAGDEGAGAAPSGPPTSF